jgi:threonine/homoserine/homoserine lactone efflux protein
MIGVTTFGSALAVGLTLAAPIGPMALLLMRRALTRGWLAAMVTGLGIATGDAIYGAIGALGMTSIAAFMAAHAQPIHIVAGAILFVLGLRTLLAREDAVAPNERGEYLRTVALTLTNPMTIVTYASAATFISPPASFDIRFVVLVVAGVFTGSIVWWLALSTLTVALRRAIRPRFRRTIDVVSGILLMLFGVRTATTR